MRLVELFCGTGGFSRGAHAAGYEVAAAYDLDPILTSSYPLNFPRTLLRHRDVAGLTGDDIRQDIGGEAFGVFGGPPCQGFSDMGKRDPSDPRRKLLGHFFRVVAELDPVFFVMENVRGLAYQDARPVLDEALTLVADRYDIFGPQIWDASEFGAATKRNRMFVIGIRKDVEAPLALADVEARKRPAATVRQALGDLRYLRRIDDDVNLPGVDRWRMDRKGCGNAYATRLRSKDRIATGHRPTEHTPAVVERFGRVRPGGFDRVGRHPRLALGGQCPTLRAGTGSDRGSFQSVRPIHPELNRVITVREAARLQGFPDDHLFHATVWHSFRMIGNSVSPIMAEAVFVAIRDRLARADAERAEAHAGVPENDDETFAMAAE